MIEYYKEKIEFHKKRKELAFEASKPRAVNDHEKHIENYEDLLKLRINS